MPDLQAHLRAVDLERLRPLPDGLKKTAVLVLVVHRHARAGFEVVNDPIHTTSTFILNTLRTTVLSHIRRAMYLVIISIRPVSISSLTATAAAPLFASATGRDGGAHIVIIRTIRRTAI